MSKKGEARSKNWFLVSYLPLDVVSERIAHLVSKQYVRFYAIAEHDKDISEDGEPKPRHVHILLNLFNGRTLGEVTRHFIDASLDAGNCFGKVVGDKKICFEYLTHKNDSEKYQYDIDIVECNDIMFFMGDSTDYDEQTYCIIKDMLDNLPLLDLVKRYGRDFMIHYNSYRMLKHDIEEQRVNRRY